MYNPIEENEVNCIHYQDSMVIKSISDLLITYIPRNYSCLVILCIGTDRSTGDSLGPLTGTLLTQLTPRNLHVYGTLHQPVHAINLEQTIHHINTSYTKPLIIAVDASLVKGSSVGNLICGYRPLQPGAALNKQLSSVGDVHVTGVVNIGGFMDYAVLQSTRLSVVHDMTSKLSLIFHKVDIWLHHFNKKLSQSIYRHANQPIKQTIDDLKERKLLP